MGWVEEEQALLAGFRFREWTSAINESDDGIIRVFSHCHFCKTRQILDPVVDQRSTIFSSPCPLIRPPPVGVLKRENDKEHMRLESV
jgi:hypothetical protein